MNITVGQAFRKMREEKGYTRGKLADELDVLEQTIFNWETDKSYPAIIYLTCAADIFECTLDELVGRKFCKR